MTDRKRDPLPEGYRFGDAGRIQMLRRDQCPECFNSAHITRGGMWRCDDCRISWLPDGDTLKSTPLTRMYDHDFTANVIEGEHFASDAERPPVVEGFVVNRDLGDEA